MKNIYPTRKEAKIVLSNCLVKDEEENEEIIVEDETLIILIENLKKVANRNII